MNFAFSEEQEQLRDAVRKFLESESPSAEGRGLMETTEGYDPAVGAQMANVLGLQRLHIPEEFTRPCSALSAGSPGKPASLQWLRPRSRCCCRR